MMTASAHASAEFQLNEAIAWQLRQLTNALFTAFNDGKRDLKTDDIINALKAQPSGCDTSRVNP